LANTTSARKRIRSAARKHERNRRVRSAVRTAVVRARREVEVGEEVVAEGLVKLASSALDKAAEHGVIHPRNAARRKSRLMRAAAKLTTDSGEGEKPGRTGSRRASAQGTKPKAAGTKAGGAKRPASAPKAGRPATKTERTAASQRKSAGTSGKEPKSS
jgi:small subunit ribosomal protein S20